MSLDGRQGAGRDPATANRSAGQPAERKPSGRKRSGRVSLRPAHFDDLGLKNALSDRVLPLLVAAMAFLAALALSGLVGASALAQRWEMGAEASLMVQVPKPNEPISPANRTTRRDRVLAVLRVQPGVAAARALSEDELAELLKPWLGTAAGGLALPMPAVIDVRLAGAGPELTALAEQLDSQAPGTLVESPGVWVRRLSVLARSVQGCAAAALVVVATVSSLVIAVATRAGLAARRDAIEIVHGMGATDGYIAGRFARRAMMLAATGGVLGALAALPVLLWLARLVAPFSGLRDVVGGDAAAVAAGLLTALPASLWVALPGLPVTCALIGWMTAQGTVRRWLRRLP